MCYRKLCICVRTDEVKDLPALFRARLKSELTLLFFSLGGVGVVFTKRAGLPQYKEGQLPCLLGSRR